MRAKLPAANLGGSGILALTPLGFDDELGRYEMPSTISKKRKRGADDTEAVTLEVAAESQSQAGPLLG